MFVARQLRSGIIKEENAELSACSELKYGEAFSSSNFYRPVATLLVVMKMMIRRYRPAN